MTCSGFRSSRTGTRASGCRSVVHDPLWRLLTVDTDDPDLENLSLDMLTLEEQADFKKGDTSFDLSGSASLCVFFYHAALRDGTLGAMLEVRAEFHVLPHQMTSAMRAGVASLVGAYTA